jgi:glycosyltransferase involved in cell wall biosynthesis
LRVLTITNMWPYPEKPWYGVFIARQMDSLPPAGVEVDVEAVIGAAAAGRSLPAYARTALKMLALNFRRGDYDLIHAHTGHCGLLACLQFRYPVLLSYVGYDIDLVSEDREGLRTRFERWLFIQLSRFVGGTIVKSRDAEAKLPRSVLSRSQRLPNGVDRELFKPMSRDEARQRLGWGDRTNPIAVFGGDPERYNKRFPLAQAAVEEARKRVPDLELEVCFGLDPELVPVYMNAADVFIMSSIGEDSPNVVKEAMACDLPVVGVDVGDVVDVIEGARHCHVCAPEPSALADAIVEVVAALPERSNGREHTQHLGLEEIAERLIAQYRDVARRGPGPLGFRAR